MGSVTSWIPQLVLVLLTDTVQQNCLGKDSHIKVTGMLVVSFRGLNYGFWSHLGCSGQNADISAIKVSFRVAREEIIKKPVILLILCWWP